MSVEKCETCAALGPLDPQDVAALKRVMAIPSFRRLKNGEPTAIDFADTSDPGRYVARRMGELRAVCDSQQFLEAVLAVLSIEHGRVRISLIPGRPRASAPNKTKKKGRAA